MQSESIKYKDVIKLHYLNFFLIIYFIDFSMEVSNLFYTYKDKQARTEIADWDVQLLGNICYFDLFRKVLTEMKTISYIISNPMPEFIVQIVSIFTKEAKIKL